MIKSFVRPRWNLNAWLIALAVALVLANVAFFIKPKEVSADSFSKANTLTESLSDKDRIEVFEKIWKAVNDKYYDYANQ